MKIKGKPQNGVYELHRKEKRVILTYRNGKKNGPTSVYKEEILIAQVNYIDDILHGPATQYHSNGEKEIIFNYKDNLKEGHLSTHSPNGIKMFETIYIKNLIEGKFTAYDMFGDICQVSYYRNGVKHGPCTTYFPKSQGGQPCRISHYENGLQSNNEQLFYTTGEHLQSTVYDKGRALTYPVSYHKSGSVLTDPAANKNRNSED